MPIDSPLALALASQYRIERELGAGGMATVFLAHDLKHDRKVALKVLHPDLAATIGVDRFLTEIRVTANLQHPNILGLFDSGSAAGQAYYVMPYVEGETLRARLERERQLPIADAIRITSGVAAALEYAHKHGVIHRDIKPENILLQEGQPLVADFGIALAVSAAGGQRLTQTGLSLGTPQYMSPEQAMGDKVVDARADIYALGVVTYEMIAGQPPFTGPSAQAIVAKLLTERPRPLAELRDRVPAGVAQAVEKAIERLPADRFASAHEFTDALERSRDAAPSAPKSTAPGSRRPSKTLLAMMAVGGAIVGALLMLSTRPSEQHDAAYSHRRLTFDGRSWMPEISPDGRYVAFLAGECDDGPVCAGDVMVRELPTGQPFALARNVRALTSMRWSADATTLAFNGGLESGSGVWVVLRTGGTPRLVGPAADVFGFVNASTLFTFQAPGTTVRLLDITSGATKDSVKFPGRLQFADWSESQNAWIALLEGTPRRLLLASKDAQVRDSLILPPEYVNSADARWATGRAAILFTIAEGTTVTLVEQKVSGTATRFSKETRVLQRGMPTLFNSFSSARDGRLAVSEVSINDNLRSFDLAPAGEKQRRIAVAPGSYFNTPHISADGRHVGYGTADYLGQNAFELAIDGGEPHALTHVEAPTSENVVGWMNDSRRAVLSGSHNGKSTLSIADLATGRLRMLQDAPFTSQTSGGASVEVAGGQIAFITEGTLYRADTVTGRNTAVAKVDGNLRRASPDGSRVVVYGTDAIEAPLSIVEVATGVVRKIATLPRPFGAVIAWGRDGYLYLPKQTALGFEIWRMADTGGAPTKFASLTERCWPLGFDLAIEAKRAVCYSTDMYPDIWLLEPPVRGK